MAGGGGAEAASPRRAAPGTSAARPCCWYIAPTIDSIPSTTTSVSRAGSSLGGMSSASSPSISARIGVTTRSTYHELAHSYGSPPACVVSSAVAVTAARWSSMSRSSSVVGVAVEHAQLRRSARTSRRASARSTSPCAGRRRRWSRPSAVAWPPGRSRPGRARPPPPSHRRRPRPARRGRRSARRLQEPAGRSRRRGSVIAQPPADWLAASGSASLTNRASRSSPSPATSASTVQWRASTMRIEAIRRARVDALQRPQQLGVRGDGRRLEVVGGLGQRRDVGLLERRRRTRRTAARCGGRWRWCRGSPAGCRRRRGGCCAAPRPAGRRRRRRSTSGTGRARVISIDMANCSSTRSDGRRAASAPRRRPVAPVGRSSVGGVVRAADRATAGEAEHGSGEPCGQHSASGGFSRHRGELYVALTRRVQTARGTRRRARSTARDHASRSSGARRLVDPRRRPRAVGVGDVVPHAGGQAGEEGGAERRRLDDRRHLDRAAGGVGERLGERRVGAHPAVDPQRARSTGRCRPRPPRRGRRRGGRRPRARRARRGRGSCPG